MVILDEWKLAELRAGILYELGSVIPVEHKRYSKTIEDAKADYDLANRLYLGYENQPLLTAKQFSACQLLMRIGQYHLYKRELEYARAQDKKIHYETPASAFDWFYKSINELTELLIEGIESYIMHLSPAESMPFQQLVAITSSKQELENKSSHTTSNSSLLPISAKTQADSTVTTDISLPINRNSNEWTWEELQELYKFHQNEKVVKKNRSFKKATAEHYGISKKRVEQLLAKHVKRNPSSIGELAKQTQLIRASQSKKL